MAAPPGAASLLSGDMLNERVRRAGRYPAEVASWSAWDPSRAGRRIGPKERGRQRQGADGPLLGRLKRAGSQAPADLSRLLHALQYAGHF